MWKYLIALVLLLVGTAAAGGIENCADCYANIIVQDNTQEIKGVSFGQSCADPSAVSEAMSSAVMLTEDTYELQTADGVKFINVGFGKIDQTMSQIIGNDVDNLRTGDKVKNKATQAAWMEKQGRKEKACTECGGEDGWQIEAGLIKQKTNQLVKNVNYDGAGATTVLNVDSKLAIMTNELDKLNIQIKKSIEMSANSNVDATANSATDVDP